MAPTCRGNLAYHTAVAIIKTLMIQKNCSKESPTLAPGLQTPTPDDQDFEFLDICDYKKNFALRHGHLPSYQHCAVFGDPHVRTFSDEFLTCQVKGSWPLLDNHYLFVQATSHPVVEGSNATVISKLTIIFKKMECIREMIYQAEIDNLPAAFVDGYVNGDERPEGRSLTIHEPTPGQHIVINASYIGTTIFVRQVGRQLSFSIQATEEMAFSFTDEQDLQLCVGGCPHSQRISQSKSCCKSNITEAWAHLLCKDQLPVEDVYFESCVFDVVTSGDPSFSLVARYALEDAKLFHPNTQKVHIFQTNVSPSGSAPLLLFPTPAISGLQLGS
ncbi:hemojuvelin-like isoform X2 [Hemicordylus capensis]|nr:hemojuvelin-like isoform X2 [Hemicordylus capensis]